jgi:hypothetical protein
MEPCAMRARAKRLLCKCLALFLISAATAVVASAGQEPEMSNVTPQVGSPEQAPKVESSSVPARQYDLYRDNWTETNWSFNSLGKNFLFDQEQIWTSPAKLGLVDTEWLVPMAGLTAGLIVTDRDFSGHLSHNPQTLRHYNTLSNAGLAGMLGAAGGMALWSVHSHNSHWRETGLLASEAALNSLVAVEAMKYTFGRDRPLQGSGAGHFFNGGQSFPSEHAAAAWSVAGVIAHEYPGPLPRLLAYGLASFISYSRVRSGQHFSSDVFVGGMLGNFVAQSVYANHHDPELGGSNWNSVKDIVRLEANVAPSSYGTPFVPLDSWVYASFDRLAALGFVDTEIAGIRPWTRTECARLTQDAVDALAGRETENTGAGSIILALQREFAADLEILGGGSNRRLQLESTYTRFTGIDGQPLNDSDHFGQTLINDFGRPYGEGFSNSTGFSGYATAGRFALYVRGEYQHAPAIPAYSLPVRQVIANVDANPLQPAQSIAATNQYQLLDTYVSANFSAWDISFGKQSLWWGPDQGGAMLISDNAAPMYMGRISRVTPFQLPWLFRFLGPVKTDFFFGKLSGHEFPADPLIHGEKISFKPTPNLEFGFSRTVVMGGVGRPFTLGALFNSYVSFTSSQNYGASDNPGKRTGGFDFSYRVPLLRNWLTIYSDSMSHDDPSPLAAPRRAAINPGLYFPRIPYVPKLELRVESVLTDSPTSVNHGGQYNYFDTFYHDLYTNDKNIIGSWIGREGQGYQAWSKYSFSARNVLQFGYRHARVSPDFIPGGGTVNDASAEFDFLIHHSLGISSRVQCEKWNYPILATFPQTNVTVSIQVTHWPRESVN